MLENMSQPRPFDGEIQVEDSLSPADIALAPEAQQYVELCLYDKQKFFKAVEDGRVVGFAKIEFSEKSGVIPVFIYRFVDPRHRRRGVGQKLRDSVYQWLKKEGFDRVSSGINGVGVITEQGNIEQQLASNHDGGWKSYVSMTRSKEVYVSHKIVSVRVFKNGMFDLTFTTHLNTDQPSLLPSKPSELAKEIAKLLPDGETLADLRSRAKSSGPVVAEDGNYYTIIEWHKKHNASN